MGHAQQLGELVDAYVNGVVAEATAPLHARVQDLEVLLSDQAEQSARTVADLEAERSRLLARIAELEKPADPAGWVSMYDSTFKTNDGWTLKQETQSNDNSYNARANVLFGEGMTILGKRETLGGRPYTSGDALGQHIKTPNYFRAEVTATVPTEFGMWPCALWFRPLNSDAGEIDVMETWPFDWTSAKPPRLVATIHSEYGLTHQKENASLPYSKLPNPDPAAPHTYVVEKTKGRITFWCDGVLVYSWERPKFNARLASWFDRIFEVSDRVWYPRVTLQVGGKEAKEPRPEWRESKMVIHRLRIFKEA